MWRRRAHRSLPPAHQPVVHGWQAVLPPRVCLAQGSYYLVTGFWPLVGDRTFQLVTGPKTDLWLVKAAGILIGVIGSALTLTGLRREVAPEIRLLGAGSALGLAGIDIVYARRRRISPIYLLDAIAELALVAAWILPALLRSTPPAGRSLPSRGPGPIPRSLRRWRL